MQSKVNTYINVHFDKKSNSRKFHILIDVKLICEVSHSIDSVKFDSVKFHILLMFSYTVPFRIKKSTTPQFVNETMFDI